MSRVCIVTDNSVQFSQPTFSGRQNIKILPFTQTYKEMGFENGHDLKPTDLPIFPSDGQVPHLLIPSTDKIRLFFTSIEEEKVFDQALVIVNSSHLSPMYLAVCQAITGWNCRVQIQLVDSLSISLGLGYLVQAAAESLVVKNSMIEAEHLVRSLIPKIYAILCTPGLAYLHQSGFVDNAQAMVGEYLGLLPLFTLDDGILSPLEKVRNHRQVVDFFQEFLDEFEALKYISLIINSTPSAQDSRFLREHAQMNFPGTPFTEHSINAALAIMFGPQTSAIFAFEK